MPNPPITLTNCDQEPIHAPGAIQPHGAFVALRRSDLTVTHASGNLGTFFPVTPEGVIGRGIDLLIEPDDLPRVREGIEVAAEQRLPTYLFTVRPVGGNASYDAIAHRLDGHVILEFEPGGSAAEGYSSTWLYRTTRAAITSLRNAPSLQAMYESCARQVRELSGFDRVMVYRFDDEWNGVVVAEDKRDDLEPFAGLHYPASDIPKQARDLYVRNWLRFIADRDYQPVPILPPADAYAPSPLDMSQSVLRSVSPIHVEYLRNMGVGASMSISLLKGDRLWGLIACHHYTPRYVPYDVRTACELLGQVMSMQLVSREEQELNRYGDRMAATRVELASRVEGAEGVSQALCGGETTVLDFVEATGAAVVVDDEVTRIGLTPGDDEILRISDWFLERRGEDEVFATDALGPAVGIDAMANVAAGMLLVSLANERRYQVIWFRPEQVRTVDWAGDPAKTVAKGEAARLSPRGSFALWKETVRGRSQPWAPAEVAAALDLRRDLSAALLKRAEHLASQNRLLKQVGAEKERILDSERSARGEAERLNRMKDEFVATLSHELRTPLNAILGWSQLLRRSPDPEDVREASEVIERNARVQSTMIEDLLDVSRIASGKLRLDLQTVDLGATLAAAVDTASPSAQAKGVAIENLASAGPPAAVSGDPTRLQQVFWNLLSNAVKFTPRGGRVRVTAEPFASHVEVSVSDSGQGIEPKFLPHVFDRFRQEDAATNRRHGGLGLGLAIVRHLVELHGGTIYAQSAGEGQGSTFVVSLPVKRSERAADRRPAEPAPAMSERDPLDLSGVRVLVIDDEPDARELLRRVLGECQATVEVAGSADAACETFRAGAFDVIVSDIGMPAVDGYQLIDRIRKIEAELGRPRTPAVALTAYARPEDRRRILLAGYQFHVAKPVEPAEITAVIANLTDRV